MSADRLKLLLLGLTMLYAVAFGAGWAAELAQSGGLLFRNGTPVGGDFINMWTVARLVLAGDVGAIYDPAAFDAFQQSLVQSDIGLRLWAYPPHILLLVWPLGLLGYHAGLVVWSAVGLVALLLACRRFGLDRVETAIVVFSPASMASLYFGQTGNLATALLLVALAGGRGGGAAAALLTVKPQAGFLLPLLFVIERRWWAILVAAAGTALLVGISLIWFGPEAWRDYVGDTLPLLDRLERQGSGPFMLMIPSLFMAMRVLGLEGGPAATIHLIFAAMVVGVLIWRLLAVRDSLARAAMVLAGTVLVTPYMHNYDLAILLAGAVLVARLWAARALVFLPVALAWGLPQLVYWFNGLGVPLSPLVVLLVFALAAFPPLKRM